MLPVLEDSVLAARASAGLASRCQSCCSTRPSAGPASIPCRCPATPRPSILAAIVLDVSALAVALQKPLSARLFPVPGKVAGERTEYDSPYLVNGAVLPLKGRVSARLFERFGP